MTLPAQDIVERLERAKTDFWAHTRMDCIRDAKITISRLTADNEALRSALEAERAAMDVTQRRAIAAEARVDALAQEVGRMREALEAARDQILDSYRTWIADDTGAFPRPGQIPRYDQVLAALGGSDHG